MSDKILVTRSSMPDMEEYIDEIKSLWDSHWLTNMGEKHIRFESMLKDYMEVENIELVVNGHMALEMTLQAYEFPEGSEVITTPFTFASTTHAIVRNGLVPVFCDIDEETYCIDATKIEALITDKTVAILPVHVYGNVCDIEAIDDIAKRNDLKVIYDAAHTFGETYKGVGIGKYGDASCFSFHATKVFNSIEGGAVCYNESWLGNKIFELKNFGIHDAETITAVGANAKMNEFAAAMGICNLRHVDEEISKRELVCNKYVESLKDVEGIRLNPLIVNNNGDVKPNYAYFPIIVDDEYGESRDELFERLTNNDIVARKYFYPLINDYECYRDRFSSDDTPVAKNISNRVLTLPMYADLTDEQIEKICRVISRRMK